MARVVVVEDAESITIPAANAILKILEEPGVKIYYIFIAENLKRVLGTIISRSVILPFNRLTSQEMDVVLRQKGMQDPDLKKILMGLPARIDQFSAISREKHLKNVKNFWQLLMTDAAAKMALVEKIAKLDKKRLMGLMFFWESCLRDYLMWQLHQSENRWWQTQEIDELYNRLPKLDVGEKLRQLSLIKEKFATVSKKIQLFNWLINT
jgi:DNA polymerase-3 subunit delta'